jgi:RHS repeat-associated protein
VGCVAGACDGGGGASRRLATKTQGRRGLWWWCARHVAPGITYNAGRQRTGIVYGNGVETALHYDAESFRLTRLYTTREVATDTFVGQDLRYAYDAVGNITRMDDHAVMVDDEERMVHAGPQLMEPVVHAYTYDALGRLITATGREHPGLLPTTTPLQPGSSGYDRGGPHPNDLAALEDYVEQYTYDAVGNFLTMQHTVPSETTHSWTRYYLYEGIGNRLTKTHGGNATGTGSYSYGYDEHGNMLAMPHLAEMDWNAYDELARTDNGGGAGRVEHHFQYDASGQRVRKVVEHYTSDAATLIEERVYFGGYELYRRHQGAGSGLDKEVVKELQTLHVMDGERRVALVDTRTVEMAPEDEDPTVLGVEARTTRVVYQLGNHLGSACLEVDEDGEVVRYEEFHPYGSSALLYAREGVDDAPKRYRFTGMECDDTGLQYHSARYLSPWLARWISPDPSGTVDGTCGYMYCTGRPTIYSDTTGHQARAANFFGGLAAVGRSLTTTVRRVVAVTRNIAGGSAQAATELGSNALRQHIATAAAMNPLTAPLAAGYSAYQQASSVSSLQREVRSRSSAGDRAGVVFDRLIAPLSPLTGTLIHGYETSEAAARGDWRTASYHAFHTAVGAVQTLATVAGGLGAARSARASSSVRGNPPTPSRSSGSGNSRARPNDISVPPEVLPEAASAGAAPRSLVHYTTDAGRAGILRSNEILASRGTETRDTGMGSILLTLLPRLSVVRLSGQPRRG